MTVMRSLKECTLAILTALKDNIGRPTDENAARKIAGDFMRVAGVPLVAGAIDGTLVNIQVFEIILPLVMFHFRCHQIHLTASEIGMETQA
jgi:hypothetical protein